MNGVRTDSGGGGGPSRGTSKPQGDIRNAIFARRDLSEKKHSFVLVTSTNNRER